MYDEGVERAGRGWNVRMDDQWGMEGGLMEGGRFAEGDGWRQ